MWPTAQPPDRSSERRWSRLGDVSDTRVERDDSAPFPDAGGGSTATLAASPIAPVHGPRPRPPAARIVHRGPGPLDRRGLRWLRVDALGLAVAVALGALAMTPSLIPLSLIHI